MAEWGVPDRELLRHDRREQFAAVMGATTTGIL